MRIPHLSRLAAPLLIALALPLTAAQAQHWLHDDGTETNNSMFRELDQWPSPNDYRTASGAPGKGYWQQQVDYQIEAALDTINHSINGWERISYHNNSPDRLRYLWLQLDQNVRSKEHSRSGQTQGALPDSISPQFRRFVGLDPFDGGYTLNRVQLLHDGEPIETQWRINNTLLKVLLPVPLESGGVQQLEIEWSYPIPDRGRGAKEQVTDGWLYEIAQWFPRLSVYDDVNGWQTDQFMGRGEFYLNFGTYDVKLSVPWDHIVDASGELQNAEEVLTATQRQRLEQAYQSEEPVFIIRPDEVMDPTTRPVDDGMLTWHFIARDVRDFAWVSSKTYVWDAAGFRYDAASEPIKVHSLYPRDAMPLWDKVSTRATIQTLKTYGRLAFEYPYPKAVNVHGPVFGMEYPMIAFCGARPQPDGSYSDGLERALIGVTIHEVGHNWFPMIVATDERKWTWMDEGLNTFLQHYGELEYAKTYCGTYWTQNEDCIFPSRRGPAPNIVEYMRDTDQVPIMIHSDLIHKDFGNNGYGKPATGLVMLREHVSGEQAFDEAFGDYAKTWMFKHPQPADFFRSMDESLGENMAWFWRGWFYTTHANDQEIVSVEAQSAEELIGSTDRGRY
ncbi:MAG: M1 family metallopeptidase, partial [Gemmatimonadales bacterium]